LPLWKQAVSDSRSGRELLNRAEDEFTGVKWVAETIRAMTSIYMVNFLRKQRNARRFNFESLGGILCLVTEGRAILGDLTAHPQWDRGCTGGDTNEWLTFPNLQHVTLGKSLTLMKLQFTYYDLLE
jgi:hypothetical protein